MFILKYVTIAFALCTKIDLYLCIDENVIDDIVNLKSLTKSDEQSQESTFLVPDDKWIVNALQDIAYYLRNHKFNEWDRRFYVDKPKYIPIGFYDIFPEPNLNVVHWRVHMNCVNDFYQCIKYLHSVIETAPFTRSDDITTTLNKKEAINSISITKLDDNCKKALLYTEKTGLPFDAPEEKFHWRTSASYYMCWYTMLGTPALSMLGEYCDNFANCLDSTFGNRNRDPRSDDKLSFACAMYSFCPDPCCPLKHVNTIDQCHDSKSNPCYTENAQSPRSEHRECRFDRQENQNLEGIIANKWNVSCHCRLHGFEWKSQFGMCVDINECITDEHNCDSVTENCFNLPGSFQCICKWGYAYDRINKACTKRDLFVTSDSESTDSMVEFFNNLIGFLEYLGF